MLFKRRREKLPLDQNPIPHKAPSFRSAFTAIDSAHHLIHAEPNRSDGPRRSLSLPISYFFSLNLGVSPIKGCLVVLCSSGGVWHPLEKEAQAQLWWGPVPLATKIPQIDICKPSGPCVWVCGCVFGCVYLCWVYIYIYIMLRMYFHLYATLQNAQASGSTLFNRQNTSEYRMTRLRYYSNTNSGCIYLYACRRSTPDRTDYCNQSKNKIWNKGCQISEKITRQEVNKIRTLANDVTARTGTNNQIKQKQCCHGAVMCSEGVDGGRDSDRWLLCVCICIM